MHACIQYICDMLPFYKIITLQTATMTKPNVFLKNIR